MKKTRIKKWRIKRVVVLRTGTGVILHTNGGSLALLWKTTTGKEIPEIYFERIKFHCPHLLPLLVGKEINTKWLISRYIYGKSVENKVLSGPYINTKYKTIE